MTTEVECLVGPEDIGLRAAIAAEIRYAQGQHRSTEERAALYSADVFDPVGQARNCGYWRGYGDAMLAMQIRLEVALRKLQCPAPIAQARAVGLLPPNAELCGGPSGPSERAPG